MRKDERPGTVGITPRFLIGGVVALAVGLGAPLLVGSFTGGELLILAAVEATCLLAVGLGWLALARRLEADSRALWDLSRRDELTGVGNYRALRERLGQEISRHSRHEREFALILIDLDGFKQVNEELGHLEGDRVLGEIGSALRKEVRDEDSVFRQGGDEFAAIAPETNSEEAEDVAARLRSRVRECGSDSLPISASSGIASFPADGRTADGLSHVADLDLLSTRQRRERSNQGHTIDMSGGDDEPSTGAVDEVPS